MLFRTLEKEETRGFWWQLELLGSMYPLECIIQGHFSFILMQYLLITKKKYIYIYIYNKINTSTNWKSILIPSGWSSNFQESFDL